MRGRKLFCECRSDEGKNVTETFSRRLTVVSGEKSEKDVAALQESMKAKEFEYERTDNSCLVEMDEEPPHLPAEETIETAVVVSLTLGCKIVDNLHFMRKIVIDGSNTSGFQRTGIVGIHGNFKTESKGIGIATVTLEEEACKRVKEEERNILYSLDRLGIPLIEISTEPDIVSPAEAREVAEAIGLAVRQSGMIRREASSIRQDLNISIRGGNRVEIKGVQSLSQIERVLCKEIERQETLLEISRILRERGAKPQLFLEEFTGSELLRESDVIAKGLKTGKRVFGFNLPGLSGLLNNGKYRLGMEIADRLRSGGVGGLIHSDELPNYGIDEKGKEYIAKKLVCGENDAFGIVIVDYRKVEECVEMIQKRIEDALLGVPAETRAATENGTRYLRPLPGSSRMYPETDIPLIPLDSAYMKEVEKKIPPTVEERVDHLESLGIPKQEAFNSLWKEYDQILESFVNSYGNPKLCAKFLSVVFSSDSPRMDRASVLMERYKNGNIPGESLESLYLSGEYEITKEKKIVILNEGSLRFEIASKNGVEQREIDKHFKFKSSDMDRLSNIIDKIVDENLPVVKEKGDNSFKLLMGKIMREVRGEYDGKEISDLLKMKIDTILKK